MTLEEIQDPLDCEALVVRYVNCCDVLLLDTYLIKIIILLLLQEEKSDFLGSRGKN